MCLLQGIFPNFSALMFLTSECLELERFLNPLLSQQGFGVFKFICRLKPTALRFRSFDIPGTCRYALSSTDQHRQAIHRAGSFWELSQAFHMAQNYGAVQILRLPSHLLVLWLGRATMASVLVLVFLFQFLFIFIVSFPNPFLLSGVHISPIFFSVISH